MWTIIKSSDYDNYIQMYSCLDEFKDELKLCEMNQLIFLPRWFYYNYPAPQLLQFHTDVNWNAKEIDVNFTGMLKKEQPEMVAPLLYGLKDNNRCGILKARPGAGKTVMSIYLGCMSKKKVLIVIDNTNLLKQWAETIYKFTDVQKSDKIDPDIFKSEKQFTPQMAKEFGIGIIQGNIFDTDYPFTIAMVQTLISRSKKNIIEYYEKIRNCGFGTWFFDECHKTVCGPKYAIASLFCNTKNIIGLSATPYANGLHDILMTNTIGNIVSDTKYYDTKPDINIIVYNSELEQLYKSNYIVMTSGYLQQRARWNKISVKSQAYLNLIHSINKKLLDKNHKIINIAFTQNQVETISKYLNDLGIENRPFYGKQKKIDKQNDNVLVATYSFAGTGFDFKELSACVIAAPLSGKKSLIQVIGRILREHEGKQIPKVFILMDKSFREIFLKDIPRIKNLLREEFQCNITQHDIS